MPVISSDKSMPIIARPALFPSGSQRIHSARTVWYLVPLFLCALMTAALCAEQPVTNQDNHPASDAAPNVPQRLPPLQIPPGVIVDNDITYATYGTRELKLDLYRPASGHGPFPGIVFIHGGRWELGDKTEFSRQAAYLATKGYVSVSIDYRFSQEAPYPAAVYDAKAAVRWMRAHAGQYKIDPNRIAAAGGSSGGHLAALLGTTSDVRTLKGDGGNSQFSSRVEAVVAFNPLTDFVSMLARTQSPQIAIPAVTKFLGGTSSQVPEIYMEASPVAHVCKNAPPFLFLHGTADKTMPFEQSTEMQKALQAVGVRAELYSAQGGNHGFYRTPAFYQPSLERMKVFLDSVFGQK